MSVSQNKTQPRFIRNVKSLILALNFLENSIRTHIKFDLNFFLRNTCILRLTSSIIDLIPAQVGACSL